MQWLDPESSNIFISLVDLQFCIFMDNMIVIGESIFGSIVSIIGVLFLTYTLASYVKVMRQFLVSVDLYKNLFQFWI